MARKALGRGISAIIPDVDTVLDQKKHPFVEIEVDKIAPNPNQPRGNFDPRALEELSKSILERGLLQPVVVRTAGEGFELIVGERRTRAARMAGLKRIPAIVLNVEQEREMLELALVENLQREDLNPIDQGRAYQWLVEQSGLTQEEVSQRVHKDRSTVANMIRLLALPEKVQSLVVAGSISAGHARTLLGLKKPQDQIALAQRIARGDVTVRDLERMIRERETGSARRKRLPRVKPPHIREIEERLQRVLGTAVHIVSRGRKGRLEIEFYSDEDLDRILEILAGQGGEG
jgi:ParB family chromosome partitioning protein